MRVTEKTESRAATRPASTKPTKPRRSLIGEFSDEEGTRHQCWLAPSRRGSEGIVYLAGPGSLPRCLGLLGGEGAELQQEAVALFADFRAATAESRRCRAVSGEEIRALDSIEEPEPSTPRCEAGAVEAGDVEQPTHFDGSGIYAWMLAERVITIGSITAEHGESKARRINGWKRGANASVQLVDELLTKHGRHLGEVPAELRRFSKRACNRGRTVSTESRERAVQRFRSGETAQELATEYGVSAHSIRNWARASASGLAAV